MSAMRSNQIGTASNWGHYIQTARLGVNLEIDRSMSIGMTLGAA